jgi:hypothetical protein
MARLGIVILSHRQPDQLLRLCRRVRASFPDTPVVVHHDFGQAPLDEAQFAAAGVSFVHPHVPTRWGDFSLVEATLAGLREMLRLHEPEWVTLVSSSDYPLHGEARVLADLDASGADACIEHQRIDPAMRRESPPEYGHPVGIGEHNTRQAIRRFFRVSLHVPLPGGRKLTLLKTSIPWLTRRLSPFRDGFACHVGSQWFSVRREALRRLLEWHEREPALREHLARREAADECYPHTILANLPALKLANRNFRYVDWSAPGSHPKSLGIEDLERMYDSGAHFARKFAPDAPVLDAIDARLDEELAMERGAGAGAVVGRPAGGER